MKPPTSEIAKYQYDFNAIKLIYDYPVFSNEYSHMLHKFGNGYKLLDFGCGKGKIYNEILLPGGNGVEYVGIDADTSLKTNFPLYTLDEFLNAGFKPRHFDGLLLSNVIEHLKTDELYDTLSKLNPYIDGDIFILTSNSACLDYMFNDPEHAEGTVYPPYYIYGLLKHLGFNKIEMWRGKGLYRIRELQYLQNPKLTHLIEMNEMQRKVCMALGLDWYGNLLVIGDRNEDSSG